MFPVVPVLCVLALVGGSGGLAWYHGLSKEEQEVANRLTAEYALRLYGKSVQQLSQHEANRVHSLVQAHLN